MTVQTPQGATSYLLGYDQAGSLKAVAAMDGPDEGRVVKVVDYDAFGNVLSDSNPALFLPLSFAGGLLDRFTGLVRFCHRDYDPTVGRFTAPDPLGDTGGDHDLYDYCVDDPVGRVDPEGLEDEEVNEKVDELARQLEQQENSQPQPAQRDTRTPPPAEPTLDQMERQGRGLPEPEVDDGVPMTEAEKQYFKQFYPDTDLSKVRIRRRVPGIFGDAAGATTGNTIYMDPSVYPPDTKDEEQLKVLPEELAHAAQQRCNPGFYFKYAGEYVWDRLTGKSHGEAYNNISYEKKAKAKAEQVGKQMIRDRDAGGLPWPSAPSN